MRFNLASVMEGTLSSNMRSRRPLVWMTRLLSQEPAHRECVEDSKGKRSVGLRRIVGKRADDAVKRLHYCHGDPQKRDCHAGTNAERDQDRQQQGDASRSRIPGEAVVSAWAEQSCK